MLLHHCYLKKKKNELKRIANIKCRNTAVPQEAVQLQTLSHIPAVCRRTTAQFPESPTDGARGTWARLAWLASGPYLVFWQLMFSNKVEENEKTEEGRYVKLTRYISHLRYLLKVIYSNIRLFLSCHTPWMVHQCWALNKQIPHFHMKWWLSHKSLWILISIRL